MKNLRSIGFYAALILVLILIVSLLFSGGNEKKIKYSQVIDQFKNRQVYYFEIKDNVLDVQLITGEKYSFTLYSPLLFLEDVREDVEAARENGTLTGYDLTPPEETPFWLSFLPYLIFGVGIMLVWVFMMNQMNGGTKAMSFGRARLKTNDGQKKRVTFADVAGADEEKEELAEVVDFLKQPKKYTDMGAHIPRGILLVGPPGTGKTYLAKATSGEAGVPFFSISGSDFVELYVGVGASRVRDTFEQAKKNAPCIVFIDEIDAVGRQRGAGLGGGHDEREQTLNQLLVEMDGFDENEGVIVMAATNRPDILDNALLRPGRFDRQIVINLPDVKAREEVLKIHAKNKPIDTEDVNLAVIAKTTAGFSPADLQNILNESALLAARRKRDKIKMVDIEDAILKVVVGIEKKSRKITEKEKKLTSYHEGGHAIINKVLPSQGPVHQISIVPRGLAGGFTLSLPQEDKNYMSKNEMFEEIVSLLGGRVAEALCLDDISTGASNDIQRATSIAKKMVTKYGMSDLGPIDYAGQDEVFIGRSFSTQLSYSEETAARIDREITAIINRAYDLAKSILEQNRHYLDIIASILMEKEKMSAEEFYAIFDAPSVPENA